ncbi:hypothetical protein E1288_42670 [Saccharopolyspora elongata]|uniref:Uncharacterized protein n=1 Tax=Saccharopolyspora elongata TaxID=2530387 RepID=A0A4R4XXC8_9PSEU|nr:hypothetical protein E1288_42670 [Saccharopolyspora elongata]
MARGIDTTTETSQRLRVVPKNISIRLDDAMCEALAELTSDGMTISEIVRTAIIEAAVRRAGQRLNEKTSSEAETYEEWVARQAAQAPPLTEPQAYVLKAAFLEGRLVSWPGEARSETRSLAKRRRSGLVSPRRCSRGIE